MKRKPGRAHLVIKVVRVMCGIDVCLIILWPVLRSFDGLCRLIFLCLFQLFFKSDTGSCGHLGLCK